MCVFVFVMCNVRKEKKYSSFRLFFGEFWSQNKIYYWALFSTPNKCYQLIYAPFKINDGREHDRELRK